MFWMLRARDWFVCPNLYPDNDHRDAAERAVAKLRDASFDGTKLSIIGKDHTEESVVGYDTIWERMKYWGLRGAFRGGMWGLLLRTGFFLIPSVGPILAVRPLFGPLLTGLGFRTSWGGG